MNKTTNKFDPEMRTRAVRMVLGDGGKLKALERESRELPQANEIPNRASAYFAQAELDRSLKR